MRISDWSSDVCSSDLASQDLRRKRLARRDLDPQRIEYAVRSVVGGPSPEDFVVERRLRDGKGMDRIAEAVDEIARRDNPPGSETGRETFGCAREINRPLGRKGRRSEEHTSEHQTLMSTSNA